MEPKREGEERRKAAWIGTQVFVKGDVVATGDLIIDGRVEGTIELGDHSLMIGEGATIVANLVAKSVRISGEVKGNVTGNAKVELLATGIVEGDIKAPRFVMEDGAVLHGKVDAAGKSGTG
jgi:cytoskeletal protein CcmA (bactofilin family)